MNRKNISVATLVVSFLFLNISSSIAQTCAIPPAASDNCINAPELSCNLDGYIGTTAGFGSMSVPSGFCGMIENNQFLSFRADESPVIFKITPSSCTTARGIQAMIYDSSNGCNNLVTVSNCGSTGFESAITVTAPVVIIGRKYHLMIDGYQGDICDYSIEVVSGIQSDVEAKVENAKICAGTSTSLNASESSTGDHVVYTWETTNGGNIVDGQNTLIPTIDATGDYTLTVMDTLTCCIDKRMITVSEDTNFPQIEASTNEFLNCSNAQITLNAFTSETGDFSYQWVGDETEFETISQPYDIIVNNQSTYSFIATNNATGCKSRKDIVVQLDTIRPELSFTTDGIIDCVNQEVNLGVSSLTNDVSFLWQGGSISGSTATDLVVEEAGLYAVTATASNGCTNSLSRNVQIDTIQPTIDVYVLDELDCATTEVSVIGNASVSVEYDWSGPNGFSDDSFDLMVEQPGIYEVEITAQNGCKNTKSVEVIENVALPDLEILPTDKLTCTNQIVFIETQSNSTILNYEWSYPSGANATSPNIFANESGEYNLTVTGSNACTNTIIASVEQDTISPITEPTASDKLTCTNFEVELSNVVSNNSSDYTYEWFDSANTLVGNTQEIIQSTSGLYEVITTDIQNGCSSISTIEIEQDTVQPLAIAMVQDTLTCAQTSVVLDGSNSSNGTHYSYEWRNQNNDLLDDSDIISVNNPESYQLIVTNTENGCTANTNAQVVENRKKPIVEIIGDAVLTCANPTLVLNATHQATSANGSTQFDWQNSDGETISSNENLEISDQGMYQIKVTDISNGCTVSESIQVLEDKEAPVFETNTPATLTCINTNTALNFETETPSSSLLIKWKNTNNEDLSTDEIFTTDQSGDYILELTNTENGCVSDAVITVVEDKITPYADTTLQATLTCINQSVELNIANSSQGAQMNYQWIDVNENHLSNNQNIELTDSGLYQLMVSNTENGCTDVATFEVIENTNPPEAKAGEDDELTCDVNEIFLGSATFNTENVSYQWVNNAGEIIGNTASLPVNTADIYQLTTTNTENGCTNTDQVIISENTAKPAFSVAQLNELNCYEIPVELSTTLENMEELYIYQWTNEANEVIATTKNVEVENKGIYTLKVTNEMNKCEEEEAIQIEENKNIPEAIAGIDDFITCSNPTVSITGSSSTPNDLSYQWINENNEILSNTAFLEASLAGVYTLNVTNIENGCSNTNQVNIFENTQQPTAVINTETNLLTCTNTELILLAETDNTSNSFEWQNENGAIFSTNKMVEVSGDGLYELVVTDTENGCTQINSIQINQNITPPLVNLSMPNVINCINEVAVVEVNGLHSYSYKWQNENGDLIDETNESFETDQVGLYQLQITDAVNGCTNIEMIEIEADLERPIAIAHVDQELDCVTASVQINGFDSSVGNQFAYEWNGNSIVSGASTLNPEVAAAGEYRLQITNNDNGCTSETSVVVAENTERPTSAFAQINDPICHEDANGIIQINEVVGGTAPYLYSFENSNFNPNPNINNLSEGIYTLSIQDAIGCEWDTTYQLISPSEVSVELGEDQLIQLGESIVLEAATTGDIQLIEWESGDGQIEITTTPFFEVMPTQTTTYEIYIEDENGCLDSDFITIQVKKDRDVYIPNAFSPNGDGVNDLFQIYSNQDVEQVTTFQIFDRWGNHVFTQNNFSPSDLNHGWDGNFRDQKMQSGVYVYMAEIEFIDGKTEIFKGDVTVLF